MHGTALRFHFIQWKLGTLGGCLGSSPTLGISDFRFPLPALHVRYPCFPPAARDRRSSGREGNISCTRRLSRDSDLFGGNTLDVQLSLSHHVPPNRFTLNLAGRWRHPFMIEGRIVRGLFMHCATPPKKGRLQNQANSARDP